MPPSLVPIPLGAASEGPAAADAGTPLGAAGGVELVGTAPGVELQALTSDTTATSLIASVRFPSMSWTSADEVDGPRLASR